METEEMEASSNGALSSGNVRGGGPGKQETWPAEMETEPRCYVSPFAPLVLQGSGRTVFPDVQLQ